MIDCRAAGVSVVPQALRTASGTIVAAAVEAGWRGVASEPTMCQRDWTLRVHSGQVWRAMVSVASGEGSFSAGGLLPSPAAKGTALSFANTASNNGVAVVLHGPFGPDELATVAGFLATVADPGARFRSHTLLQWTA